MHDSSISKSMLNQGFSIYEGKYDISKPNILFISPVLPSSGGNGLAMRGGIFLEALAELYNIYLVVVPLYGARLELKNFEFTSKYITELAIYNIQQKASDYTLIAKLLPKIFEDVNFKTVFVFRLYMAPYITAYVDNSNSQKPQLILDLDELDSKMKRLLAEAYKNEGQYKMYELEIKEALQLRKMEQRYLPLFEKIFLSSPKEIEVVSTVARKLKLVVLPNVVRQVTDSFEKTTTIQPTLLFIGNLGYYPNEDGVMYFCKDILPLLRKNCTNSFKVIIAGTNPSINLQITCYEAKVELRKNILNLTELYQEASIAIVPLRLGAGTSIKVLEAFSYQVPVVSTDIGVRGLDVVHNIHTLISGNAEEFTKNTLYLMDNIGEGRRLAYAAYNLYQEKYSLNIFKQLLYKELI